MKPKGMLAVSALIALLLSACAATGDGTTTTAGGQRMVPVSIEQVLTLSHEAVGVRAVTAIGLQCLRDGYAQTVEIDAPERMYLGDDSEPGWPDGRHEPLGEDVVGPRERDATDP